MRVPPSRHLLGRQTYYCYTNSGGGSPRAGLRLIPTFRLHALGTLVGETGFEPAAWWSQTTRSTKLSYSPINYKIRFFLFALYQLSYLPMMGRVRFELTTTDSQNQRKIFAVRILMAVPQRIELWSSDRQSDIISTIRWNHAQRLFSLGASPSMPTLCDEVGDYLPTFSRLCAHCGKDIKLLVSFPLVFQHLYYIGCSFHSITTAALIHMTAFWLLPTHFYIASWHQYIYLYPPRV